MAHVSSCCTLEFCKVPVILPVMGPFSFIGFDAANVVRSALHELAN